MKKALVISLIALVFTGAGFGVGYQFGHSHGCTQVKIWEEPPRSIDLNGCLAYRLKGYDAEVTNSGKDHWGELTLRILDQGEEAGSWTVHPCTVFAQYEDVLYLADYSRIASGCTIIA